MPFYFRADCVKYTYMANAKKIKMAVLIGNGGRLQAILECAKNISNIDVSAIVSHKTKSQGIESAKQQGLDAFYFRLPEFADRQKYNLALADKLEELGVNFIVMAGWNIVLSDEFLRLFPNQVINIHPSLLPAFPGPWNNVSQAILGSGVRFTGCTLHFVPDSGIDSGPIILQAVIPLEQNETKDSLREKLDVEEEKILCEGIKLFAEGKLKIENNKVLIEILPS